MSPRRSFLRLPRSRGRALVAACAVALAGLALSVPASAHAASGKPTQHAPASSFAGARQTAVRAAGGLSHHESIDCDGWPPHLQIVCPDTYDSKQILGDYVGHDEPGVHFYSHAKGSGNRARWLVTMPKEPAPSSTPGADNYSFENHVAFWLGMALCANQSFPEQLTTCKRDSDSNIVNPKKSQYQPGSAYLELQFYPPGYSPLPSGISCDPTHWCVAMNIWSYYVNPVTNQQLDSACQKQVGGVELDNFAFLTHDGRPTGPPNPLDSDVATFTPNKDVTELGEGDKVAVTIEDSASGLLTSLDDVTSGQTGYMIASAQNGFGQMVFATDPSTTCQVTPYSFHPMYSTSTPQTRSTWTALTYNIAYSDETGHFDYCSKVDTSNGTCTGKEGPPGDQEPADSDDTSCFAPSQSLLVKIGGCVGGNLGWDGTSYLKDWPNGDPTRPTPIMFSSPLTGSHYNINYSANALVTDLPLNESGSPYQHCDIYNNTGCTHIPITDDGQPAAFYPYFYSTHVDGCTWGEGQDYKGLTVNDFGKVHEYGTYDYGVYYTGPKGVPYHYSSEFRKIYPVNLCPAKPLKSPVPMPRT
ncbi:MAG TPA: hypothetical protein VGM53_29430 [Streptosporangiaceae bacterium]